MVLYIGEDNIHCAMLPLPGFASCLGQLLLKISDVTVSVRDCSVLTLQLLGETVGGRFHISLGMTIRAVETVLALFQVFVEVLVQAEDDATFAALNIDIDDCDLFHRFDCYSSHNTDCASY